MKSSPAQSHACRSRGNEALNNVGQASRLPGERVSASTAAAAPPRAGETPALRWPPPWFRGSTQAAFSVLEIMVAVALLAVIIIGLLAMFYQVQRAFRAGTAQVDVMEGGRAAISLLMREMQEAAAADLLEVTNLVIVPSYPRTPTPQTLSSGEVHDNILHDLCFLQRRNDEWTGVAYRLTNAISGVGTLVRYSWSSANDSNPFVNDTIKSNLSLAVFNRPGPTNYGSQVLDGVVHFQVEAYDADGVLYRDYRDTVPGQVEESYVRRDKGKDVFAFMSTNLPAYLDLELRVLEPATLARFRVREQTDLLAGGSTRLEYLNRQIGRTHVFRQRIPVRAAALHPF
jgi:Tfp pilus assembly protein PilV